RQRRCQEASTAIDRSCSARRAKSDYLQTAKQRSAPLQRTKCVSSHRPIVEIHCIIRVSAHVRFGSKADISEHVRAMSTFPLKAVIVSGSQQNHGGYGKVLYPHYPCCFQVPKITRRKRSKAKAK